MQMLNSLILIASFLIIVGGTSVNSLSEAKLKGMISTIFHDITDQKW